MKSFNIAKNALSVIVLGFILCSPALAAGGGLDTVKSTLENISTALTGFGIVICTIAFIWLGFKMFFQQVPFQEISRVFGGAMLVGGAATFAGFLLG